MLFDGCIRNRRCGKGKKLSLKTADPENIITYYTIIKLIEVGKLTALKYGNAWLINLDELYCVLGGKPYEEDNVW